ncbi:acyltransferase, partial [Klebsiella pneumoniae]|nr:acyltransferase [Klebsiella pneumoniae]
IAAIAVQFKKIREWKEAVLATVSKAMTGFYILHYSVFHLLVMLIPVHSLDTKLGVIALTFVLSVLNSLAALSSTLLRKV